MSAVARVRQPRRGERREAHRWRSSAQRLGDAEDGVARVAAKGVATRAQRRCGATAVSTATGSRVALRDSAAEWRNSGAGMTGGGRSTSTT